jgi:hypothetical protein
LTKAYDVIYHNIVLDKLDSYGIRGITNLWFKSYLTHREEFVEIDQIDCRNCMQNKYISSNREIARLILGSLSLSLSLSLSIYIYIYVLPLNIQGENLVLFADDTNLLITEKYETALQHKLKIVMKEFIT